MRSTLAVEAAGGSEGHDRGTWIRAFVAQLLHGYETPWRTMKLKVPYGFGTDCRSLYDTTVKTGSSTREKRIAMDLQDVRDGVDEGDQARWIPTEVMLADGLTKRMTAQDLIENTLLKGRYAMWCDNFEGLYNREDDPYAEIELPPEKSKMKQTDVEIALKRHE